MLPRSYISNLTAMKTIINIATASNIDVTFLKLKHGVPNVMTSLPAFEWRPLVSGAGPNGDYAGSGHADQCWSCTGRAPATGGGHVGLRWLAPVG